MKSAPKIINLLGKPKRICQPLTFPLTEQDLTNIQSLKYTFRNTFVDFEVFSLGLSAPQIEVWKRFVIMPMSFKFQGQSWKRLQQTTTRFHVYVNPVITWRSKQEVIQPEYCFSVDDAEWSVRRPELVQVKYYNQHGQLKKQQLDRLRSRVMQHEVDHLDGILMSEKEGAVRRPNKGEKVDGQS